MDSVEHDPQQNPQQDSDRSEDSLSDSAIAPLKQKPGALMLDLGVINLVDVSGSRSPRLSSGELSSDLGTESPGTLTPRTPGMNPRRSSLIKTGDRKMSQVAAFSPALAYWELARQHPDELIAPGAFDFESALLFVDISGFTALCTKLDIDVLQRHINTYFGELIDVVSKHDGDVLRFVGDALFCAWSLPCGAEAEGTLALATLAACRCALELHQKCSSYLIKEANEHLSMCAPSPPPPSPPPPSPSPTLALSLLPALAHPASRGHLATPLFLSLTLTPRASRLASSQTLGRWRWEDLGFSRGAHRPMGVPDRGRPDAAGGRG
jgi:hypothetical protein